MNKKAKMYVGLGVVAVAAYYFYMQSKKKETPVAAKFIGLDANKEYYRKKREQGVITNIRRRK